MNYKKRKKNKEKYSREKCLRTNKSVIFNLMIKTQVTACITTSKNHLKTNRYHFPYTNNFIKTLFHKYIYIESIS